MYYKRTGETDKAIDASQLGTRNFPRDWTFHNDLSELYIDLGQYEEGLKEGLEAARLQADVEPPYRRQLDAYICLDRLPEAKLLAEKLRAMGLGGARIHQRFLEMAYVEGDHLQRDSMVCRQAGGVPQPGVAGGRPECPWPAPRVARIPPASCGDSAAPGTPGRRL